MEKYGFVYIWFDRKHKRYYIGCHWGTENDGYVCSSSNMKSAYQRRPNDFKRKILSTVYSSKRDLLEEEFKWLSKIRPEELGRRYYNLHNHHFSHWSTSETSTLSLKQKISTTAKKNAQDPTYRAKYLEGLKTRDTKSSDPSTRAKRRETMLSGGKNKGKITAKDLAGNIFHTTKDDPRWIAGEIWAASKGIKRPPISEEHKERIRCTGNFRALNSKKISCIHCGAVGNVGNISRYHNDRCKHMSSQ